MALRRGVTVTGAIRRYNSYLFQKHCSDQYRSQSRYVLRRFAKGIEGKLIVDLTRREVRKSLREIFSGVKPSTYSHYSRVIRLFFEFCKKACLCLYNYVREFNFEPTSVAFYTPHQLDRIFRLLPLGETRDACRVIYHTGIGIGDLDAIVSVKLNQLVLMDRTVMCQEFISETVRARPFYMRLRIQVDFKKFVRAREIGGNLRFLQNSYLVRAHLAGTPLAVMRSQIGFRSIENVTKKVDRLTRNDALMMSFHSEPFKDYLW
jgi:hypothetical protein